MKKILAVLLTLTLTLLIFGCAQQEAPAESTTEPTEAQTAPDLTEGETAAPVTKDVGEGKNSFVFTVTFADGSQHIYNVSTDEEKLGDALVSLGLIEGEEGPYGLYVKKVDGVTADYDEDGTYWAFYIDGASSMTGVSETEIEEGAAYEMKVETM